jgi:hypothetical protein
VNWERRPRKGERSRETARSDQEHAIRKEYGDAGELRGLIVAWSANRTMADQWRKQMSGSSDFGLMADAADACAEAIAVFALERFPKRAAVDLGYAGASVEYVESVRRTIAEMRERGVITDDAR